MTAQSLIDRQLILSQITLYYYNFGKVERQSEESFYAEDGELMLGTRHYKDREGTSAAASPRERTAFNVTIDSPLIIVHDDTATSQVIFTEYRQEKPGDPMKMTTQGKEYASGSM